MVLCYLHSMYDTTESIRRQANDIINREVESTSPESERARLEAIYGKGGVWDTTELQQKFKVTGFAAPFCMVEEKATGKTGLVTFQHSPRLYFDFQPC